jgi:hypothetical protein
MSDQIELYRRGQEAAEKLDYFICGVAGALFAYIGQTYQPHKIEFGITLIEPFSLLCLAAAFLAGLRRIEASNAEVNIEHDQLKLDAQIEGLAKLMEKDRALFEPQWAAAASRRLSLGKVFLEARAKASRYYHIRNRFLICGLSAVFLSKLLSPYAAN